MEKYFWKKVWFAFCVILLPLILVIIVRSVAGSYILSGLVWLVGLIAMLSRKPVKIGNWELNIWRNHGFAFLFHYEGNWNSGTQKRLYILFWEINFEKIETNE